MAKTIEAKIRSLKYRPGETTKSSKLRAYPLEHFDINGASASGVVSVDSKNSLAYSKWVTPKRTRSYPFARIYDTYSFGGKRVTVIPIIKDEGLGQSKNKSNNDRINFITLSWMNLTNVYIVLAWYSDADKKSDYRITKQKFDDEYVRQKIREISEYQLDAHHWNNQHFVNDFSTIYRKAVSAYQAIGTRLAVEMHPAQRHENFLAEITDLAGTVNLEKFAEVTLARSRLAAAREITVKHEHEHLSLESEKLVFAIENNLGGRYSLTADELIIDTRKANLTIREAKNSTQGKLPGLNDIKDGLFKILLFSQIDEIYIDDVKYTYEVGLRLTGKLSSTLSLPAKQVDIETYVKRESLTKKHEELLLLLNEEATNNRYQVEIAGNMPQ